MADLVAINNKNHKNLRIDTSKAENHGADLNIVPVVINEFNNLAVQYPIVLTKNGDTGQFVFVAMLGFEPKENLFWNNNHWEGIYLPLQIQRQPFFVGQPNESSNVEKSVAEQEYVVCFDQNSPTIITDESDKDSGDAVFTESGAETEFFQQAKSRLGQLLQGESANKECIDALQELNLLQPLSLEITFVNKKEKRLNGLYCINQEVLAKLDDATTLKLHKLGFLQPIYTMVTSLGQIYSLIDKKNKRLGN